MIVAELQLTQGGFGDHGVVHSVAFDTVDKAMAEFERVSDLMKRKHERGNDLPELVEVTGPTNKITLALSNLRAVALMDFALANAQQAGVRDAFPNIFKR